MHNSEIPLVAATRLLNKSKSTFIELLKHGSLSVELYKPRKVDNQQPHDRDEVYVIASGMGTFFNGARRVKVKKADFLFVAAGVEHRFEKFTADFSTWVFFYGPVGGEVSNV